MFENLSNRLGGIFDGLMKRGVLTEDHVAEALRMVRVALLEADVALPVAKEFIEKVRVEAVGEKVLRAIKPGQQVIKIVHDVLIETLGHENTNINLNAPAPAVILMAGLQGSGKTTSAAKLAKFLSDKHNKKVLLASLDIYRPAAQEQLEILSGQINGHSLPIVAGQKPIDITKRALDVGRKEGFDIVILDSAGRLSIDDDLMRELSDVAALSNPIETFLVADALTGQDAVTTAQNFQSKIPLTGIILTRIDGDARGGAALSMRRVTGQPIKFLGVGETVKDFEIFDASRIAGRILDMGDVVSLVEKAVENIDAVEAQRMAEKMAKGDFDLNDFLSQLRQMKKMGGLSGLMSMMPGMGKMKKKMDETGVDDSALTRQEAIILSMTKKERVKPAILNASRRRRIADGSGTQVQDVNRVMKQFLQMQKMMKKMNKMGDKGMMRALSGLTGGLGGGIGNMMGGGAPDMAALQDMAEKMKKNGTDANDILGPNPFDDK